LERIPSAATEGIVTGWERREIVPIVRSNSKFFRAIDVNVLDGAAGLTSHDADTEEPSEDASYNPREDDRRQLVERQIRERRGQQKFRDGLRKRYGNRCLVTGSELLAVLEAAHICPYRGEDDNDPQNGLLLRSDIHTLFDLDLLGIEPEQLRILLHPDVVKEYGCFVDVTLGCTGDQQPSRQALKIRFEQFRERLQRPA
jgi:hypothetical protein